VTVPPIPDEPYPGLRSFRRDETHIFFGREACINDMVRRVAAHRFLAVTGTSGSGKSSLVRTGLLDALDRGLLAAAGADWRVADFPPGNNPLSALASGLINAVGGPASEEERLRVEAILARGPLGLLEWLESTDLSPATNLLVLADQFEEIFRFRRGQTGDDINAFVALLLASASQRARPIYVVITMRSDFLGECAQFAGLAEMINDGQYLTPRLTREQCREAIEGPAGVFGGRVESALTNRLLNDMGTNADQLPLVQHVLMRLWRISSARSGADARVLKLEDYEKLGGIGSAPGTDGTDGVGGGQRNALSAHADEILSSLDAAQQGLASILFRALTESQGAGRDVRRPIPLGEAAAIAGVPAEKLVPVIDAFRAPGRNLLTPPINVSLAPGTVIDVSHESLIRQWGTLRQWLREEFDAARTFRTVENNAKLWRDGDSGLMTMPYLGVARAWRDREHPNASWAKRYGDEYDLTMDFLDKSLAAESARMAAEEAARRRSTQRTRSVAVAMAVLAMIAGVFGYISFETAKAAKEAAAKAERSETRAQQMSTEALQALINLQKGQSVYLAELAREDFKAGDLLRSLLYSVEALPDKKHDASRPSLRDAEETIAQGYLQLVTQKSSVGHAASITRLVFLAPGNRIVSASRDGTARVWDLNGTPLFALDGHVGAVTDADVAPDGKRIVTASVDGVTRIWDAETGHLVTAFVGVVQLNGVRFRKDGKAVVTAGSDGVARVWDIESGHESRRIDPHAGPINSAEFNADGSQLLIVTNGKAQVYDVKTQTSGGLSSVSSSGTVPLVGGGKFLIEISAEDGVKQAGYSADGSRIAVLGTFRTAAVWDAKTLRPIASFDRACCNKAIAISPDGSLLALVGGMKDPAEIFDVQTKKKLWEGDEHLEAIGFSPDGSRLITNNWGLDTGSLSVWDARAGTRIAVTNLQRPFAVSPDSRLVAAFDSNRLVVWDFAQKPQADDTESKRSTEGPDSNFGPLLDQNGQRFLLARNGGPTTVWDSFARRPLGTLLASYSSPAAAFDPKGQWIAALSAADTIGVWASSDLQHAADIQHIASSAIGFSPDGRFLASSTTETEFDIFDDGAGVRTKPTSQTKMFETGTWRPAGSFAGIPPNIATAFSLDGQRLVTAVGSSAKIWDIASARELAEINGPANITDAIFGPDGKLILTVSADKGVRLWNATSGELVTLLSLKNASAIPKGQFSPDGTHVAFIESDKTAWLWSVGSPTVQLGAGKHYDNAIFDPNGTTVLLFNGNEMSTYDLGGGQEVTAITLLEGAQQSGIEYVSAPLGSLVASTDGSVMKSGTRLWRMPWSTQTYVELVQQMLPRCLTQHERQRIYLDPAPPAWCIEMEKWPYDTAAWKQWLADKTAGKETEMPTDHKATGLSNSH
jgi:WD40 repeat protein